MGADCSRSMRVFLNRIGFNIIAPASLEPSETFQEAAVRETMDKFDDVCNKTQDMAKHLTTQISRHDSDARDLVVRYGQGSVDAMSKEQQGELAAVLSQRKNTRTALAKIRATDTAVTAIAEKVKLGLHQHESQKILHEALQHLRSMGITNIPKTQKKLAKAVHELNELNQVGDMIDDWNEGQSVNTEEEKQLDISEFQSELKDLEEQVQMEQEKELWGLKEPSYNARLGEHRKAKQSLNKLKNLVKQESSYTIEIDDEKKYNTTSTGSSGDESPDQQRTHRLKSAIRGTAHKV